MPIDWLLTALCAIGGCLLLTLALYAPKARAAERAQDLFWSTYDD